MGGIETVAAAIEADLVARLPRQNKKQRAGLALLVATALDVRDVNLMELAAALPRAPERLDMRYQWISRLLGNALIDTDEVMAPFAREGLARASPHACADDRPEPSQRRTPDGDGVPARGWARPAAGLAREENPRRHRLWRAARGLGQGGGPAARGGLAGAEGR